MKAVVRSVLRAGALRLLRIRTIYSPGNIEILRQGRCIVCANHVSFLDGVVLALVSPIPLTFGVDTDFSKRSKLASLGMDVLSWLGFGAVVPVDSGSPFGVRALLGALNHGRPIMIFPEGAISKDGGPLPIRPGAAWLVQRAGAEVIHVRIHGAEKSRFFAKSGQEFWPKIEVHF